MIQKYNLLQPLLFLFIILCTSCTTSSENLINDFEDNRAEYEQIIISSQAEDIAKPQSDENIKNVEELTKLLGIQAIGTGDTCAIRMIMHETRIRWSYFALASGYIYRCDNAPPEYARQVDDIDAHRWDLIFRGEDGEMVYQQIDENWFIFTQHVTRSIGFFSNIASLPTTIQILLICLSIGFIYTLFKGVINIRHNNNSKALLNGLFSLTFLFTSYLYCYY